MGIAEIYCRAIARNLHVTANWEPDVVMEVGDYGTMHNGVFTRLGNVSSILNAKAQVKTAPITGEKSYQSKGMKMMKSKLGASVGPDGAEWVKAGLTLQFTGKEAIAFQMIPEKRTWLENTQVLASEMIWRYESGHWQLPWVVVIETTTAKSGIVLVSAEGKTEFQLEANVPSLDAINLRHPELDFAIERQTEQNANFKLNTPSTPLISVARLNRRWFGKKPVFRGSDEGHQPLFFRIQDLAAEEMYAQHSSLDDDRESRWILEEVIEP